MTRHINIHVFIMITHTDTGRMLSSSELLATVACPHGLVNTDLPAQTTQILFLADFQVKRERDGLDLNSQTTGRDGERLAVILQKM